MVTALAASGFAITKHGSPRGCYFQYNCNGQNCDMSGVQSWITQACEGIGGSNSYCWTQNGGQILAKCGCAHGNTGNHHYEISGPYPAGTAELVCNVNNDPSNWIACE